MAVMILSIFVTFFVWNRNLSFRRRFAVFHSGEPYWRWFTLKDSILAWNITTMLTATAALFYGSSELTGRIAWSHNAAEAFVIYQVR